METKHFACLIITLVTMLNPTLGLQQAAPSSPNGTWPGHWHMWGFWWIFPLFMFLIMIVCFFTFFGDIDDSIIGDRGSRRIEAVRRTIERTLRYKSCNERYARGEIQRQEYEEKKTVILSDVRH